MRSTRIVCRSSLTALVALVALRGGIASGGKPGDPEKLVVGQVLTVELGSSDPSGGQGFQRFRAFDLVPARDGPLTVIVEAVDADVLVRRVDAAGAAIAEDDDGGIEWNARLVVEGVAGAGVHLLAGFKSSGGGKLCILAREGVLPEPTGVALDEARAEFFRGRGRATLARGEKLAAAIDLHEAGQLDLWLGQFARCRQSYATVRSLADELHHPLLLAVAQAHLGAVHLEFQELPDALALLQEAVDAAVKLQNGPLEMLARSKLGEVLLARGDLGASRACFERALGLAREAGDRGNEVCLCSRMGQVLWRAGDGDAAGKWHEQALALARTLDAPVPLALALLDAGRFQEELCRYARARELLEEARVVAPTLKIQAAVLGHLGDLARHTGDSLGAVEHYERVLAAARELEDAGLESTALYALAQGADWLGDFDLARQRLAEAFARLGGAGAPRERAGMLSMSAMILMMTGDFDAARRHLDEALALARQAGDRQLEAQCLAAIVALHYHRQEFAEAMDPARRQLAIGRELGLPNVEAVGLINLAELHLRTGDLEPAREMAEQAVAMVRRLGNPRYLQSALLTQVEIVQKKGDASAMADIVAEAEACFEEIDASRLDPEKVSLLRAQDVFAKWGEYSQDLVALSLASGPARPQARSVLEEGFRRAGLWKARALLQGIAEHRRGGRNPQTIALRRDRREVLAEHEGQLARIAAALRKGDASGRPIEELRAAAHELERRADELTTRLRELAPADAALDAPEGASPGDLAQVLGDENVLVEFVDGRRRLYAYALWRGSLTFHDLGERDAVNARVSDFLAGMDRPDGLASASEIAGRGRRLYEELLAPALSEVVPPDARLIVVPTASLSALPFEALVADAPDLPPSFEEVVFVLDRREVCYAASTPVLVLLADMGPRSSKGPALILADPISPEEAMSLERSRDPPDDRASWGRLPGTRSEAIAVAAVLESAAVGADFDALRDAIAEQLDSSRSLSLRGQAYSLHVGADATPDRMRGDRRDFAIIHCASHGWVDLEDPRRSGLVLTASGEGDGVVSVAEILEMDLDAEMAVLSACETGRGAVRRGEGALSMARAFLYAGSRSVVASLWKVDDRAAEQVMERFYSGHSGRGLPLATALRAARLAVRHGQGSLGDLRGLAPGLHAAGATAAKQVGHPYSWAPFVLFGLPPTADAVRTR